VNDDTKIKFKTHDRSSTSQPPRIRRRIVYRRTDSVAELCMHTYYLKVAAQKVQEPFPDTITKERSQNGGFDTVKTKRAWQMDSVSEETRRNQGTKKTSAQKGKSRKV
jgi:hypothetical protein